MIYLYVKTHQITKLKYLGKTINDPFKYKGSGKYWLRHIKKHGYFVDTEILYQSEDPKKISEMGLYYSNLWNIMESEEWANLIPESGHGGNTSLSENYLNAKDKGLFGKATKNKTYEEIHGVEKARELRQSRSESNKKREKKPETALKISIKRKEMFKAGLLKTPNQFIDPIRAAELKRPRLEKIEKYRNEFIESNLSKKEFADLHNVNRTTMKKYLRGL